MELNKILFKKKPSSIPAEYRPLYKIAQIVAILRCSCRGNKASLLKLHLFSWALKTKDNMLKLQSFAQAHNGQELSVWGIEPTLNRALQIAVAEGLLWHSKSGYALTEQGIELFNLLEKEGTVLNSEIIYLNNIGKSAITESRLKSLTTKWKMYHA